MRCKKCDREIMREKQAQYNIDLCEQFDININLFCSKCLDDAYHAAAVATWTQLGELK
jgi:hypothetical protein